MFLYSFAFANRAIDIFCNSLPIDMVGVSSPAFFKKKLDCGDILHIYWTSTDVFLFLRFYDFMLLQFFVISFSFIWT